METLHNDLGRGKRETEAQVVGRGKAGTVPKNRTLNINKKQQIWRIKVGGWQQHQPQTNTNNKHCRKTCYRHAICLQYA